MQVPPPLRARVTAGKRQRGGAGPRPPPRVSRRTESLRPAAVREWAGVPPFATARRGQQRAPCRPACSCSRSGASKPGHTGRGGRGEAERGLPARRCHRRGAAGSARGLRQHRRCDGRLAVTRHRGRNTPGSKLPGLRVHPRARARVSCFAAVARVVGFCGFSRWYLSMAMAELVLCKELLKCKYQAGIIEIYFFQQKQEVCLLPK